MQAGVDVLGRLIDILSAKYPNTRVDPTTDILAAGLANSLAFTEIILTVEEESMTCFHHELLDFDGPLTPSRLAQAFQPLQMVA